MGKSLGRVILKDATSETPGTSIAKGGINVTSEHPGDGSDGTLIMGKVITRNTGVESGVIRLTPLPD